MTFLMLRRYAFVCFEASYSEGAVFFSAVSSLAAFIGEKRPKFDCRCDFVEDHGKVETLIPHESYMSSPCVP